MKNGYFCEPEEKPEMIDDSSLDKKNDDDDEYDDQEEQEPVFRCAADAQEDDEAYDDEGEANDQVLDEESWAENG